MKKFFLILSLLVFVNLIISCTASLQSSEGERIYVFDEQNNQEKIDVKQDGEYPNINETYYVVQIGAFTTKERAENFAESSRKKIDKEVIITYSENNNLYLVQISPFFRSRQEAELIRDELKVMDEFKDVWIVTVNK